MVVKKLIRKKSYSCNLANFTCLNIVFLWSSIFLPTLRDLGFMFMYIWNVTEIGSLVSSQHLFSVWICNSQQALNFVLNLFFFFL